MMNYNCQNINRRCWQNQNLNNGYNYCGRQNCTSQNEKYQNNERYNSGNVQRDDNDNVIYSKHPHMTLTMAYVPKQYFGEMYDLCKALKAGTLFSELDKPFLGCKGGR